MATLARELELLRASLNVAIREWEWLETSPFTRVRIEQPRELRERWFTPEEETSLMDASPTWLRNIMILALNTGMRKGEILALKWTEVSLTRKALTVFKSKNREKRTLPLNRASQELLEHVGRIRHISGLVFPSKVGSKINTNNVQRAFVSARNRAGIKDAHFHDLRHTFATRLAQEGIDLYTIQKLLGHKSFKMTMRYAHHSTESLRHGVDVLERFGNEKEHKCYDFATVAQKRATASP